MIREMIKIWVFLEAPRWTDNLDFKWEKYPSKELVVFGIWRILEWNWKEKRCFKFRRTPKKAVLNFWWVKCDFPVKKSTDFSAKKCFHFWCQFSIQNRKLSKSVCLKSNIICRNSWLASSFGFFRNELRDALKLMKLTQLKRDFGKEFCQSGFAIGDDCQDFKSVIYEFNNSREIFVVCFVIDDFPKQIFSQICRSKNH